MTLLAQFRKPIFLYSLLLIFSLGITSQTVFASLFNTRHNSAATSEDPAPNPEQDNEKAQGKNPSSKPVPSDKGAKPEAQGLNALSFAHMNNIAVLCKGHWEQEACLKELSSVSMDITRLYADALNNGAKKNFMEPLKQHCAASTAALKISVPAYAMHSAITECVNQILDINEATSIKPDLNLYQLLVGAVLCLGKDPSCEEIERSLSAITLKHK